MKKLSVIALLSLAAASSWAQGTVQFQNAQITFPTAADRLVYIGGTEGNGTVTGGAKLLGTNYAAGLFFVSAPDQNTVNYAGIGRSTDNLTQTGTGGSMAGVAAIFRTAAAGAGIWNNGTAGNTRTLDGIAIGSFATLQVRVWDGARYGFGAQGFQAAYASGNYGASHVWTQRMPDFAAGDPSTAGYMDALRAFTVVPEPSTIALGVLGVVGLLALRRRKQA